ncbi:DNA cytosine methyltransferase [Chryseobacterium defluvii]|uniref:DNA (cytosine-5-)-methyltransferase n=1 Tax=Chryseobacterium defluvii TaxID=160396 RepID=A0A495SNQ8_9FLAO|nr:DNA cytosine methyltransferase [Chryseobacterium defluvii]RKT01070.1 DNA (cytosine-5)-methyltransferase 1 [Chryseobacterium defluvii]
MKNKYIEIGLLAISLLYVDLFCGAGGTSTGVETAKIHGEKCAKVIACVNHDANAIASHAENHPESLHFTEDIRTLELGPLVEYVAKMRKEYPFAKLVLWASLECTNFSKAKGGLARDADSRTLAEHLDRYIEAINPDSIQIENVEEFMSWGDLDEKGKPISKDKGRLYIKWVDHVKKFGYNFDYRILNSADFGALTSRKRFFAQFNKGEFPIVWPEPTHAKNPVNGLFESLEKWRPVKEVLDFSDEGESIFDRKTSLVEATLERFYSGLIKFVAGGKDKWLLKYNSINGKTRKHIPPSVDEPCPVISTQGRLGVVNAKFLAQYNSGKDRVKSIEEPCNTVTTNNRFAKVECSFLSKYFSGNPDSKNISIEGPAHTITTIDHHSLVQPKFMSTYYGKGSNISVNSPAPTVTTKDRIAYVNPTFIDVQYGNGYVSDINKPVGVLTTNPKQSLVTCNHFLMNPQYNSPGGSIENPCFTLIARMDKMPPYLIEASDKVDGNNFPSFIKVDGNTVIYEIYENDSPMMKQIKEFMAIYGLVDLKMRMLKIQELKEIMGFPKDYVLIGTQADQKKFIGNAVEVTMARKICEATANRLFELRKAA